VIFSLTGVIFSLIGVIFSLIEVIFRPTGSDIQSNRE